MQYNMYKEAMSASKEDSAEEVAEDDAIEIIPLDVEESVEEKLENAGE